MRTRAGVVVTLTLAVAATYMAGLLALVTADMVGNVLVGHRYREASLLVLIAGGVFACAGTGAWIARRRGRSWVRAARLASVLLIAGSLAAMVIHFVFTMPF